MQIWEIDKLVLFLVFVIPGFVSIKFYQLLIPGQRPATDQLVDAIAYSCINYALIGLPVISFVKPNQNIIIHYIFSLFTLFFAPIIWVFVWKIFRTRRIISKAIPHPILKPWDYIFSQRKKYWVKVILKDQTCIAGKYAENSFTSSAPAPEQIYLEESWIINEKGGFERAKNNSKGVLILSNEISYIELIAYEV